jgi:hypothetical protein
VGSRGGTLPAQALARGHTQQRQALGVHSSHGLALLEPKARHAAMHKVPRPRVPRRFHAAAHAHLGEPFDAVLAALPQQYAQGLVEAQR